MRIIDIEAHPLIPAGLEPLYSVVDGALTVAPNSQAVIAQSLAEDQFDSFADDLLGEMDRYEIEMSVILRTSSPVRNKRLAELIREYPDRFTGFAAWDDLPAVGAPVHDPATGLKNLGAGLDMPELKGVGEVSLWTNSPDLSPEQAAAAYEPTMELCRSHACPIMFHTGSDGPADKAAYRDPAQLEPLVSQFPEVPLILAHMGGQDEVQFENSVKLAQRYPNVYLSTSRTRSEFVERAVTAIGAERLVFATDWSPPLRVKLAAVNSNIHDEAFAVVNNAAISDRDKELIFGENLAALLGI